MPVSPSMTLTLSLQAPAASLSLALPMSQSVFVAANPTRSRDMMSWQPVFLILVLCPRNLRQCITPPQEQSSATAASQMISDPDDLLDFASNTQRPGACLAYTNPFIVRH